MLIKILIVTILVSFGTAERIRYDNHALYKVHAQTDEDVRYLDKLQDNNDLVFWKSAMRTGEYASVVAPPALRRQFEGSLKKRSIHSELMVENIQEAFDAQLYSRRKRDTSDGLYWTGYQTLEDIYKWFDHLAQNQSNVVSLINIGKTHEGRNITGVRISRGTGNRHIVLEGGQIGADWLSPTVLTYIVNELVQGTDAEAKAASEEFVWHIFPMLNPDGHEYSNNAERLWMKNRYPVKGAVGVDLSKNWNSQWGIIGANFDPSTNSFPGLGPFSEVETRSLSQYIESVSQDLVGFFSFRGYGQRLLIPMAHTTEPMYNFQDMLKIGRRAMGSLSVRYNTHYEVGTSGQVHDGATGAAADWVKFRFRPPLVATYQLRDNGSWGYTLPVSQVQPSCEETYDSLMAILREAKHINVI